MTFLTMAEYGAARNAGRVSSCSVRKVPSQATIAGWWVDFSMAAGNPQPNYYASDPLVAAKLAPMRGIFHGDNKAPYSKWLTEISLMTPTAGMVGVYKLLDYLLYYPFIDFDATDEQALDNVVPLDRYADGDGVMAMLVAVAPTLGGGSFTFNYINQTGVEKTSPVNFFTTTAAGISSIATYQPASVMGNGPFLKLADGDTGVRSIVSFTNVVPGGGLGSLVLVKPLIDHTIKEINTENEMVLIERMPILPKIEDAAYLNFIMNCAATVAGGALAGRLNYVWDGG